MPDNMLGQGNLERDVRRLLPHLAARLQSALAPYVGRRDGPNVGLFDVVDANGRRLYFQVADTHNVPFASAGVIDGTDTIWLHIGREDAPALYLEQVGGLWQVRLDADALDRAITAEDIDLENLAAAGVVILGVVPPTDALEADPGALYLDQTTHALYVAGSSAVDRWQVVIGGYMAAAHGHFDLTTGGQLDHGAALTAASLADDDHPQYLLRSDAAIDGGYFTDLYTGTPFAVDGGDF